MNGNSSNASRNANPANNVSDARADQMHRWTPEQVQNWANSMPWANFCEGTLMRGGHLAPLLTLTPLPAPFAIATKKHIPNTCP